MLAVLIINHGTAPATQACLAALADGLPNDARVFVLDNGSGLDEVAALSQTIAANALRMTLDVSADNLGFAGGMNRLLHTALADSRTDQILLLNSDTRPLPGLIAALRARLDHDSRTDMVAAQMSDPRDGSVDSLGITLYRSTLASNRKRESSVCCGASKAASPRR